MAKGSEVSLPLYLKWNNPFLFPGFPLSSELVQQRCDLVDIQ